MTIAGRQYLLVAAGKQRERLRFEPNPGRGVPDRLEAKLVDDHPVFLTVSSNSS
jgi:hypothetical protein